MTAGTGAADEPSLEGTAWMVTAVATGNRMESGSLVDGLTLEFGVDGAAFGSGGCNRFRTGYAIDGARLTFDVVASTRMACDPHVMAVEQAYLAALERVTEVRRDDAGLRLVDDDGAVLVTLVPAPG